MVSVNDIERLDNEELRYIERRIDNAIEAHHTYKRNYEYAFIDYPLERVLPILKEYMKEGGWKCIYYKEIADMYAVKPLHTELYFSRAPIFANIKEFENIKGFNILYRNGDDPDKWDYGILENFEDYDFKILQRYDAAIKAEVIKV